MNANGRGEKGMKTKPPGKVKDGEFCEVIGGTHAGKSGTVRDIHTSKTGHVTITVVQRNGERFKTLAKNVVVQKGADARYIAHIEGKGGTMKSQSKQPGVDASQLIDERIDEVGGWRGDTLARMRALIRKADPEVVEEWKWMNPVWSHDGGICTGETYKAVVKLTFFKGASLKDPARLFNSSLDGNVRRAIDIREDEEIDAKAFQALIRAAAALNMSDGKKSAKHKKEKIA
jgi:hypothetical protein